MNVLAWDAEVARLPESETLDVSAGLGVGCAVTMLKESVGGLRSTMEGFAWYGLDEHRGSYMAELYGDALMELVRELVAADEVGVPGLTWNGAGFDYALLGYETGAWATVRRLALNHIDLMLLFAAVRRHRLSLRVAAEGVGSAKGVEGLSDGVEAVRLWPDDAELVLAYCSQDCRALLDVYTQLLRYGGFGWVSRKGQWIPFDLPRDLVGKPERWTVGYLLKEYEWLEVESWITEPVSPGDEVYSWL